MKVSEKEQQLSDILTLYRPLLTKVCYMYAPDEESFKDLYQETIINLWQGLDRFRGDAQLSTWIYRIAFNTCVSYKRTLSRRGEHVALEAAGNLTADDNSRDENLRTLYSLISRLNPVDKALIMMWLDEKTYDEMAEVIGLSKANVATRIHRIKNRLIDMGQE